MCEWNFTVRATVPVEHAQFEVLGNTLELVPATDDFVALTATGSVRFDCEDPGNCQPKIHRLRYTNPPALQLGTLEYSPSPGTAFVVQQAEVQIVQPTVAGDVRLDVVPTGDGSAVNVTVVATLALGRGSATWDPPDIPVTIPGGPSFAIPTPPVTSRWGPDSSDVFSAQYLLSCCKWDEAVREFDREKHSNPEPNPWGYYEAVEVCGIGCCYEGEPPRRRDGASPIQWSITALEGGCDWTRVHVEVETSAPGMTDPPARAARIHNEKRDVERTP